VSEIAQPSDAGPVEHAHDPHVSLSLERLVYFSDAVFAIAITLLVLEIRVPALPLHSPDVAYWNALLGLLPKFFAFVLSFLVIGRLWMAHHQLFTRATGFHGKLLWPNTVLLLLIAFMPFATAFLGDNLGAFVPTLIYDVTLLVVGLMQWWLARVMLRRGIARPVRRGDRGGSLAVSAASVVSIGIALYSPPLSQLGMLTIPLWTVLIERRRKKIETS
jgi:uncharacterized membrane protein